MGSRILAAVARQTQSYKEVNEKKTRKTKAQPRPLKTLQSVNTLTEWTEWEIYPAMAKPSPRPWVLMNQTPHIRAHTLMINPCPLPPVFLLAVLYANPNSRAGCLRPPRSHYVCVCGCIWSLKHTMEALHWATSMPIQTVALPTRWGAAYWRSYSTSKVHSMANGMTEGETERERDSWLTLKPRLTFSQFTEVWLQGESMSERNAINATITNVHYSEMNSECFVNAFFFFFFFY